MLVVVPVILGTSGPSWGQQAGNGLPSIVTLIDGQVINWPEALTFPADSLDPLIDYALGQLRDLGHLLAEVDSVAGSNPIRVFISKGPELLIDEIVFTGDSALSDEALSGLLESRAGRPFIPRVLEEDIAFILRAHGERGWPLTEVAIASITPLAKESNRLRIEIDIDRGPAVSLHEIRLPGASRTRPAYVSRLTGLKVGQPINKFIPAEIRAKLLATNLFRSVGDPRLVLRPDGDAQIVIDVEEEPPGNFDLVLGYVPKVTAASGGGVVGTGHLELRNLFGGGRRFNLQLNRLPGRVSSVDVAVADPNLAGLPVGLEGGFNGLQQDSTYDRQRYFGAFTYEVSEGLRLVAGASREVTKPGQAGVAVRTGRQRIPRSVASFFGIGVRYESLDFPVNPRRGLRVESMFERGNKNRTARFVDAAGDTLTSRSRLNQERLSLRVRYYLPTTERQVVALGADAQLVISDEYDESDLIRLGGARSLRGYNEEQFLGRLAGRVLVEYRYQLDRFAFAYVFTDLGVVETAPSNTEKSRRDWLPGFGIGTQFRTEIGIINVSYAFNDRDGPIDGRVHVGLSFSL